MKIGILCAGDEELAPFLPLISNCKITEKAMLKFHAGQIDSVEVVALFSGVCKVNAAIAAQLLIDVFIRYSYLHRSLLPRCSARHFNGISSVDEFCVFCGRPKADRYVKVCC